MRSPALVSCPNFRDLGGYPTEDGRMVRYGRIYRSGTLVHLAEADHDALAPLGIRTICDLRHVSERELEQTAWRDGTVDIRFWDYRSPIGRLLERLSVPEATTEDAVAAMEVFYVGLPMALAPAIRDTFAAIAVGQTPLLFHCSAGKDRTGVVAGMILEILGVPRATTLDDYARSQELMDYEAILAKNPSSSLGLSRNGFSMSSLSTTMRAPLLASHPRYLAATFTMAETTSGSIEAYLIEQIGVDPGDIARVRAELLD